MVTRAMWGEAKDLLDRLEEDATRPTSGAARALSSLADTAAQAVFHSLTEEYRRTPEYRAAQKVLVPSPAACGGFRRRTAILEGYSPFEQMVALRDYVEDEAIRRQTLCLAEGEDECIPVSIQSHSKTRGATSMQIMLGWTCGKLRAPSYPEWEAASPADLGQAVFEHPLAMLEAARQPDYLAALALKTAAHDSGAIGHGWRYEVGNNDSEVASVELKGQNTSRVCYLKERAFAQNVVRFFRRDREDRTLLPNPEDRDITLTPEALRRGLRDDLAEGTTVRTEALMSRLLAGAIGSEHMSPVVREWCVGHI